MPHYFDANIGDGDQDLNIFTDQFSVIYKSDIRVLHSFSALLQEEIDPKTSNLNEFILDDSNFFIETNRSDLKKDRIQNMINIEKNSKSQEIESEKIRI